MTLLKQALIDSLDYPQDLLDFANDKSAVDWLNLSAHDDSRRQYHQSAVSALKIMCRSRLGTYKEGNKAIENLKDANVTWSLYLEWNEGLFTRQHAHFKGAYAPSREKLDFAIAQIADICVDGKKRLIQCDRCEKFALRDSRGGGGNPHRWCSTKCGTANAQKQKRIRDNE